MNASKFSVLTPDVVYMYHIVMKKRVFRSDYHTVRYFFSFVQHFDLYVKYLISKIMFLSKRKLLVFIIQTNIFEITSN